MNENEELETFRIRCSEAERAIEDCIAAFEFIPFELLQSGQNWIPSEVAIHLLKKAKDSVTAFANHHGESGV